jgi:5-methylcytosine-specific restriction endonuclease McrA
MDNRGIRGPKGTAAIARLKHKKPKVLSDKTRNDGTWTEARYRGFITSALRSASRRWPPKYECLKAACVGVQRNPKTNRDAKHYLCKACGEVFPQKQVQVDHIDPIGHCVSWDLFIEKLFCESGNLQVVCKECHKKKTKEERESKQESGRT